MTFKVKSSELLFAFAYYPWVLAWILTATFYKDFLSPYAFINIWQYVGLIFLFIKLMLESNKISYLLLSILMGIIGIIITIGNGNASFVAYSIFLILSSRTIEFDNLVRNTMICQLVIVFMTVLGAIFNILPNLVETSVATTFIRTRYSLGFTYSTFLPNFFTSIVLEYAYLKKRMKWTITELIIVGGFNFIIYQYTQTRTAYILVWGILLVFLWDRIKGIDFSKTILRGVYIGIYILSALLALILTIKYSPNNPFLNSLNAILSQRLRFGQLGLQTYPVTLFGTNIKWESSSSSYFYIDSSYINMLISYGVVLFAIILISYSYLIWRLVQYKEFVSLVIVLIFWALRAIIDPQLFLLWHNPFLFLLLGSNLLDKINMDRESKKHEDNVLFTVN